MAQFGGTGAKTLKDGINSIFSENGPLNLPEEDIRLLHIQVKVPVLILLKKLG